ncbi:MAG: hypothetical protein Q9182_003361 [Xanthomendoza sp. 2 TL-2023]
MLFLFILYYVLNLADCIASAAVAPRVPPDSNTSGNLQLIGNERGPSVTYIIPSSRVRITLKAFTPRVMDSSDVSHLMLYAINGLDDLATRAGGPNAQLHTHSIQWDAEGLKIVNYDATLGESQTHGGPFRFDELRAVYSGVRAVAHEIGFRECTVSVDRISSGFLKRKIKFLGNGYVMMNNPRENEAFEKAVANETAVDTDEVTREWAKGLAGT